MAAARPLADRFWEKVDKSGDCWVWTAYRGRLGYGEFRTREDGKLKAYKAHRMAFILAHGAIPEGKELDHLCRNRACVNPAHLEPVDHRTNVLRGAVSALRHLAGPRKRKTHCKYGHQFTPENTMCRPSRPGRRQCRTCHNEATRQYKSRRRAERRSHAQAGG